MITFKVSKKGKGKKTDGDHLDRKAGSGVDEDGGKDRASAGAGGKKSAPRPKPGQKKRLRGKGQGVTEKEVKKGGQKGLQGLPKTTAGAAFEDDDLGTQADQENEDQAGTDQEDGQGSDGAGAEERIAKPRARKRKEGARQAEQEEEGEENDHQGEQREGEKEGEEYTDRPSTEVQPGHAPPHPDLLKTPQDAEAGMIEVTAQQGRRLPVLENRPLSTAKVAKALGTLPGMACSTCTIGPECPEFKEGYACAFQPAFEAFPTRSVDGVLETMRYVVEKNKQRLMFAYVEESIVSGGHPDPNVTSLSETVMRQSKALVELDREVNSVQVRVSGSGKQTSQAVAAGGESILARFFGGSKESSQPPKLAESQGIVEVALHPDPSAEGAERTQDDRGAEQERVQGGQDESGSVPPVVTFDTKTSAEAEQPPSESAPSS